MNRVADAFAKIIVSITFILGGLFFSAWMLMFAVGEIHSSWTSEVPTISYGTSVLLVSFYILAKFMWGAIASLLQSSQRD